MPSSYRVGSCAGPRRLSVHRNRRGCAQMCDHVDMPVSETIAEHFAKPSSTSFHPWQGRPRVVFEQAGVAIAVDGTPEAGRVLVGVCEGRRGWVQMAFALQVPLNGIEQAVEQLQPLYDELLALKLGGWTLKVNAIGNAHAIVHPKTASAHAEWTAASVSAQRSGCLSAQQCAKMLRTAVRDLRALPATPPPAVEHAYLTRIERIEPGPWLTRLVDRLHASASADARAALVAHCLDAMADGHGIEAALVSGSRALSTGTTMPLPAHHGSLAEALAAPRGIEARTEPTPPGSDRPRHRWRRTR